MQRNPKHLKAALLWKRPGPFFLGHHGGELYSSPDFTSPFFKITIVQYAKDNVVMFHMGTRRIWRFSFPPNTSSSLSITSEMSRVMLHIKTGTKSPILHIKIVIGQYVSDEPGHVLHQKRELSQCSKNKRSN